MRVTPVPGWAELLREGAEECARFVVDGQQPADSAPETRERRLDEARRQVQTLVEAVTLDSPELFVDTLRCTPVLPATTADGDLRTRLELLGEGLRARLPADAAAAAQRVLDQALSTLEAAPSPSCAADDVDHRADLAQHARRFLDTLLAFRTEEATRALTQLVDEGLPIPDLYLHVLQPTLYEVGRLWQRGEIGVAEEHFCTAAVQLVMSQLHGPIFAVPPNGRRLLSASLGDELHDIGIRMVADLLALRGWETTYLGARMPVQDLVDLAERRKVHVVALSTTLAVHLPAVGEAVAALRRRFEDRVRIVVGGRPFVLDPGLARSLEADGCAADARAAVDLVEGLVA